MDIEKKYLIGVIERYKNKYRLSGSETFGLFKKYGAIDWITDIYIALNSSSNDIEDVHRFIEKKKKEESRKKNNKGPK